MQQRLQPHAPRWVSPKLKKLRRAVAGEAALLATFRTVTGRQPEGLDAAEFGSDLHDL